MDLGLYFIVARAQGIESAVDPIVPLRKPCEVANGIDLAQLRKSLELPSQKMVREQVIRSHFLDIPPGEGINPFSLCFPVQRSEVRPESIPNRSPFSYAHLFCLPLFSDLHSKIRIRISKSETNLSSNFESNLLNYSRHFLF